MFDYTITGKTPRQVRGDLGTSDIIHAHGGSTFHLLLQAQRSGFIKFIRKFVADGGIYIGSSAGSIIDGPDISVSRRLESKPFRRKLAGYKGFGLVDFVTLAHWGEKSCEKFYLTERMKLVYRCEEKIIRNYSPVYTLWFTLHFSISPFRCSFFLVIPRLGMQYFG